MELSVVTTLYYSENYINEFYERVKGVISTITEQYEIIFVNDGSPDNVLELAVQIQQKDARVKIIDLSRNFGHHKAMMTGLENAKGKYIIMIDSDLEEEPELLVKFWEQINKADVDVVYGVQQKRKGNYFEKISGGLFYTVFNWLSCIRIPPNALTMRIMSKRYVDSLKKFREQELMLAGIAALTGFEQEALVVHKKSSSKSTYSISKKLSLMINAITSFSAKPLMMIFNTGIIMTILAFLGIIMLILRKIFYDVALGWTSVIISIWAVGGVVIFCLGIIGIYISKIFMEVKNRPYVIIRKVYGEE